MPRTRSLTASQRQNSIAAYPEFGNLCVEEPKTIAWNRHIHPLYSPGEDLFTQPTFQQTLIRFFGKYRTPATWGHCTSAIRSNGFRVTLLAPYTALPSIHIVYTG